MLTLIFVVTTIICAIGWLIHWVGTAALTKYMMDKNYTPPSSEEMKACCIWVWKKLLHIK